ncbi:MAG: class I SAM-dependent methyltransferase, partial [Candidatus Promineifilaceae bacterium]
MTEWHDDEAFWSVMAPFMFDEDRWASTAGEIDSILALAGPQPAVDVLDLGCGPGRHTLELARRGFQVTGVDRTDLYLATAREEAEEEGLEVELVHADMREFVRPGRFDLALNLFTTFGYFDEAADNEHVLDNVYISLREGGLFLIEMSGKEIIARIFEARNWLEQNGVYRLEQRRVIDDWRRMENTWTVFGDGEPRS